MTCIPLFQVVLVASVEVLHQTGDVQGAEKLPRCLTQTIGATVQKEKRCKRCAKVVDKPKRNVHVQESKITTHE